MKNLTIPPGLEDIQYMVLNSTIPNKISESNPMTDIVDTVCRQFKIQPGDVYGPSKEQEISECRQMCMFFLKSSGKTLSAIGRHLNRTHSAIHTELNALHDYLTTNKTLRKHYDTLVLAL